MAKRNGIYKCEICGNIVTVLHEGAGQLVCCGKPMQLLVENTVDAAKEKHVPVIEVVGDKKKGEWIKLNIQIGKEIGHPNTTAHHIRWLKVIFLPDGEKYSYELAKSEFNSHGESIEGPDKSTIYTHPQVTITFKTDKPGKIIAFSYCNIHGLWQNTMILNF